MGGGNKNLSNTHREFLRTKAPIEAAALREQDNRDPSRLLANGRLCTGGDESLIRQEKKPNLIDSVQNSAAQARRRRRRTGLRPGLLAVFVVLAGPYGSFETASGREVANVVSYGSPPVVTFSPDGDLLAIAANSGLRLIETASGTERARLDGNFIAAAFSPDGRWLAVGENEAAGQTSAALIETATGMEVARVEHEGTVGAVAFSPDGRLLATASTTRTASALQSTVRLLRVNP